MNYSKERWYPIARSYTKERSPVTFPCRLKKSEAVHQWCYLTSYTNEKQRAVKKGKSWPHSPGRTGLFAEGAPPTAAAGAGSTHVVAVSPMFTPTLGLAAWSIGPIGALWFVLGLMRNKIKTNGLIQQWWNNIVVYYSLQTKQDQRPIWLSNNSLAGNQSNPFINAKNRGSKWLPKWWCPLINPQSSQYLAYSHGVRQLISKLLQLPNHKTQPNSCFITIIFI